MDRCCGFISLEVGSAFSGISLLIVSIAELILQKLFDMEDVERAAIVIHAFVLFIGAVSLLTGVLLADEICTFIFVIFWFGTMLSEIAAVLVISTSEIRNVYHKLFGGFYFTILFAVHTYMMLIAFCLGIQLWHNHHHAIIMAVRGHSMTLRGQHVI